MKLNQVILFIYIILFSAYLGMSLVYLKGEPDPYMMGKYNVSIMFGFIFFI
jgi:hypothetical protein